MIQIKKKIKIFKRCSILTEGVVLASWSGLTHVSSTVLKKMLVVGSIKTNKSIIYMYQKKIFFGDVKKII